MTGHRQPPLYGIAASGRSRVSTEEIVEAYRATGSVWRAGKQLGISGQTVHERLRAIDYPLAGRRWSDDEDTELRSLLAAGVPLAEVGSRLGRTYAAVACRASEIGARANVQREKKLPRGAGWDKASTRRHMKALNAYAGKPTQYARANGMNIDTLVHAFQRHCPEEWRTYLESHADLPIRVCEYCEAEFVPANGKQRFCTRACGSTANSDASYFGGRRRETVGLAEKTCQLCKRVGMKGLSSHHVLGKENDPDNRMLVALCQGCHKVVTLLATRLFVDDEQGWEALISLAWLRRHGAEWASGDPRQTLFVCVDLEHAIEDDEDELAELRAVAP